MKLYCQSSNGRVDVTDLATSINWKGSKEAVARSLEVKIASSPTDGYLPKVSIELGNLLTFYDDKGTELFRGYVFFREKALNSNELVIRAYDGLIYLLKNKGVYNFKNQTPEQITSKVCGDFGIPVGNVEKTGIPINKVFVGDAIYDIIMTGYTEVKRRTGKKFMPRMSQGKLDVIEKGKNLIPLKLTVNTNITDSSYSENIENMVNVVKIVDSKGKVVGEVKDDELIKMFGTIQDVYKKEKDVNPNPVASGMLKGVEQTANLSALGDISCITGDAVMVEDTYTGLVGKFYIESDDHKFENGQHLMSLILSFDLIMDEKDVGDALSKKKDKKEGGK